MSVRHVNRGDRMRWEIMILDNVPGGAGYVAQIMRPGGLEKSLGEALKIASCGSCPEESTCYACLRSMGNQALHDKMQRGPAMRFIRAVCDRIGGASGVFGVDVDRWLRAPDVLETLIVIATLRCAVQRSNFSGSGSGSDAGSGAGGCCRFRMRHLPSDHFAYRVSSPGGGHSTSSQNLSLAKCDSERHGCIKRRPVAQTGLRLLTPDAGLEPANPLL